MGRGPTDRRARRALKVRRSFSASRAGSRADKAVEIARTLVQLGAEVRVVMTRAATTFVGPQTFASVSGHPVVTKLFTGGPEVPHVEVARGADLAIVAPATANVLAKMARGVADDVVGSTWLMLRCPAIVAPAMHTEMWEHEATQENVRILAERGATIVGPASGALLSGDEGPGRLEDPHDHRPSGARGSRTIPGPRGTQARDHGGRNPGTDRSGALYR